MHAVQRPECRMKAAQFAFGIPMCAAMGESDRKPAVLLQEPCMARKSVAGWLKIAEDERLDIGSIPALLQECGLDGAAQEAAVVVLACGLLGLQDRRHYSEQGKKQ